MEIILSELIVELFIFSCLGWMMEVTLKYIQYHRFINRGFLIGPYCPIYGCGVVAVTVLVGGVIGYQGSYTDTFLAGFVLCGALEYFVSWYMEKMFHARWWDYSGKPMNLNGRIWIGNLILFGLGSIVIIKLIDPWLFTLMERMDQGVIKIAAIGILLIFLVDNIVSHYMMILVKNEIDSRQEDNTEEISSKIQELLRNRQLLIRRIQEAYPNLQARPARLTSQLKVARAEVKAALKNVKDEMKLAAAETETEVKQAIHITSSERQNRLARSKERLFNAREKLRKLEEHLTISHRDI